MENSKIEWTHHTANLWWGCTKVHEGCDNCYAENLSHRFGNDIWGNDKLRKPIKKVWADLERYQRLASQAGEIHRVFVGSMMDIFEKPMDLQGDHGCMDSTEDLRQLFFMNISRGLYPNLMFLLLTKRPSNINKYIPESWKENPPSNVMFGTSPVNQLTAETLIPQLLKVNGKRFLSIEPMLDKIDLISPKYKRDEHLSASTYTGYNLLGMRFTSGHKGHGVSTDSAKIDWIIVGGESGHNKRPFDCNWARNIREFCAATQVPFFFKQIDKIQDIPNDLLIREFPQ